jgi:hypothetical protein
MVFCPHDSLIRAIQTLCAFGFNFAPWREIQFSPRRKVKTEGAKEEKRRGSFVMRSKSFSVHRL